MVELERKFPAITVDFSLNDNRMALRDVDASRMATLEQGHVLVKPMYIALCATDKGLNAGTHGGPPPDSSVLVTGHEVVVQVTDIADDVKGWSIGDKAVAKIRRANDQLDLTQIPPELVDILRKRPDLFHRPDNWKELGMFGEHGLFTEVRALHADRLIKIPDSVDPLPFVLGDGLSCVVKCVRDMQDRRALRIARADQQYSIFDNDTTIALSHQRGLNCAVLGAGSIGQAAAMVFISLGNKVTVFDTLPEDSLKASIVKRLGATYKRIELLSPSQMNGLSGAEKLEAELKIVNEAVREFGRFQYVFDGTGSDVAYMPWRMGLDDMGVIGNLSIPHGDDRPIEVHSTKRQIRQAVLQNQDEVYSVNAGPEDWEDIIPIMSAVERASPGILREMITADVTFAPGDIIRAAGDTRLIKPVVDMTKVFT